LASIIGQLLEYGPVLVGLFKAGAIGLLMNVKDAGIGEDGMRGIILHIQVIEHHLMN
tara:strand:+ start:8074 stop:8244 length:171 start_codon:yes stop_codon:yes gene_type:complete